MTFSRDARATPYLWCRIGFSTSLLLGAIAATFAVTVEVQAADDEDETVEEVIVSTQRLQGALSKLNITLRETPQSVSVIHSEFLEQRALRSLDDAVGKTTGVTQQRVGGTSFLYARGFEILNFQQDGMPRQVSFYANGQPDMIAYDRLEILRGASGLLQGSGNPSAVVNLVRKRPTDTYQGHTELTVGSWDFRRWQLDVSSPVNETGTWRARGAGAYEDREFFTEVAERERTVFYGVTEYDVTSETTLSAGVLHQSSNGVPEMVYGFPRYADGGSLNLSRTTYLAPAWSRWKHESTQAFASSSWQLASDWNLKINVEKIWEETNAKRTIAYGPDFGAVDPALNTVDFFVSRFGHRGNGDHHDFVAADINLAGTFTLLGHEQSVLLGANYNSHEERRNSANYAMITGVSIVDFDPYSVPEPTESDVTSLNRNAFNRKQYGVFALGRFKLSDALAVIVGSRVSWWEIEQLNRSPRIGFSYDAEFTPYGGVVYDINDVYSLYAGYAEIFQPQGAGFSARNVAGRNGFLPAISGSNYEAGVKADLRGGRLYTTLAIFRVDQTGRAQPDVAGPSPCPVSGEPFCQVASGEVRSEGVELEFAGEALPGLEVSLGYTYNSTEYLKDAVNEGLAFSTQTPEHMLKMWLNYSLGGGSSPWSLGVGATSLSKHYAEEDLGSGYVRGVQPAFTVVDARIGYELNEKWTAALNLNNVLDEKYYAGVFGVTYGNSYGDPFNVMLSVKMDW